MFGLQKQRRNAAGGGAWFIAGHLTIFAKLSHHAVPLESRIFSSRCFSVPPSPPSHLPVVPPSAWLLHISPSSLYVTIRRRQHILIDPRNLRQDLAEKDSRRMRTDFRISATVETPAWNVTRYPNSFLCCI